MGKIHPNKDFARTLYISEKLTQAEIANRTGCREATVSNWIKKEGWDKLRKSLLTSRQELLSNYYMQLDNLNTDIKSREVGFQFATSKEVDAIVKYAAAIRSLEYETSTAQKMDVSMQFCQWLRTAVDQKQVVEITNLLDSFIKASL